MNTSEHYEVKLVLIGDSDVGKSSLIQNFCDEKTDCDTRSTIGVDFRIITIAIDDYIVKLNIWDTAGQERFDTITSTYYRGAQGFILVYDITNKLTFQHLSKWTRYIDKFCDPDVCKLLVGNKWDLKNSREVEVKLAEEYALQQNMIHMVTSAKTSENVEQAFYQIAALAVSHLKSSALQSDYSSFQLNGTSDLDPNAGYCSYCSS